MGKQEDLDKLKAEMLRDDTLPLKTEDTNLVFGVGNPNSKILCVGEGPGYHENIKGEPFVGNAGMLLNQLLLSIELKRQDVYITNVVHHRPLNNRDPEPDEIVAYGKYLDKIIEIINPKIIITLGRFSMGKFIPGARISSIHGKVHKVKFKGMDIVIVPMYHPAAALRNGEVLRQIKEDFLRLPAIVEEVNQPVIEQGSLI